MAAKERFTVTAEPALLARIDRLAELREESRSAAIERLLERGLQEEEKFLDTLDDPIQGAIFRALLERPHIIEAVSKLIGQSMDEEEKARIRERAPAVLKASAKRRDERRSSRRLGERGSSESA